MSYVKNSFCGEIIDGEYTLVLVHNFGKYIKIRTKIWNNIQYYIENNIILDERLQEIFNVLVENKVVIEKKENLINCNSIILQLTSGCNLNCAHCCAPEISIKGNIDYETIDSVLELAPQKIALSGGEPMVHPEFWEIIKYIRKKYNGVLTLMTNATLIKESNLDYLCDIFDYFDISLDGKNAEDVKRIRGEGVYDKVIKSIKLLKKKNREIGISIATEKNKDELREFYDLADYLEVKPIVRELSVASKVNENFNVVVEGGKDAYIQSIIQTLRKFIPNDVYLRRCGMTRQELFIDIRGNIYPCGNLAEDRFCIGNVKDIIELPDYNSVILNLLEDEKFYKCKDCKYRDGCWECVGDVVNYSKIDKVFFEYCECSKKKWKKILGELT